MGFKTKTFATETVDIGNGYWIKVKTKLAYKEMEQIAKNKDDQFISQMALYLAFIHEWNLDDENEAIVPINEETIREYLTWDVAKKLQEVTTKLIENATQDSKKE